MAKNREGSSQHTIAGRTVTTRTIVLVVAAILAIWFILMNTASVKIHLWGLSTLSTPMWVMTAVIFVIGILIGKFLWRGRDR